MPFLHSNTDFLNSDLNALNHVAEDRTSRSAFQRFVSSSSDVNTLRQINRGLDFALQAFQVWHDSTPVILEAPLNQPHLDRNDCVDRNANRRGLSGGRRDQQWC